MIAALFVETGGSYFGLAGVDPWDEPRDARLYAGPHPVVAHPPCQRWGRFWHGSTFDLCPPPRTGGWVSAGACGGWTCYVEQGHYGHIARKGTWLYARGVDLPELRWGRGEQRLHPVAVERYGYAKARRIGMMAMVGGKDKTRIRNATPPEFRDVLIAMARTARLPMAAE